jgi:HSP20 family protein
VWTCLASVRKRSISRSAGHELAIASERTEEQGEKGETFHRIQHRCGRVFHRMTQPCAVDEEKIDANYRDGVLTISAPKSEECKARPIEVKAP